MENEEEKNQEKKNGAEKYLYVLTLIPGVYITLRTSMPIDSRLIQSIEIYGEKFLTYKSEDLKTGRNTGVGYAFEDCIIREMRNKGFKVSLAQKHGDNKYVDLTKNGVDLIIDGIPFQLKCYKTAKGTFDSLLDKHGMFRYENCRAIIVPKEQEKSVRRYIKENPEKFPKGQPEVNPPHLNVRTTRKDAERQRDRGWESCINDAKDLLGKTDNQVKLILAAITTFMAVIGLETFKDYLKITKDQKPETAKEKFQLFISRGKQCLKKHWKKGLLFSTIAVGVTLGHQLYNLQTKRPAK